MAAPAAGDITLAHARVLATVDHTSQGDAVKAIKNNEWGYRTAEDVKRQLYADQPPVGLNGFKLDLYKGEFIDQLLDGGEETPFPAYLYGMSR